MKEDIIKQKIELISMLRTGILKNYLFMLRMALENNDKDLAKEIINKIK